MQNVKSYVQGEGVRDGSHVHLDLVHVVDDDVELSEQSIFDYGRRRHLLAVFYATMEFHVGDGFPLARVPQ